MKELIKNILFITTRAFAFGSSGDFPFDFLPTTNSKVVKSWEAYKWSAHACHAQPLSYCHLVKKLRNSLKKNKRHLRMRNSILNSDIYLVFPVTTKIIIIHWHIIIILSNQNEA